MADADPAVDDTRVPATPVSRARRGTPLAAAVAVLATLIGLLVLAWAILFVTKGRFLKHPFERIAGGLTHRTVRVAGDFQFYFDPVDVHFHADGLSITNPAWASRPYLFRSHRIDARIAPFSFLWGRRRFHRLELADGAIDLEWRPDHATNSWTFSDKKGGKPLELPLIDRATLAGTTIRYLDPRMRLLADIGLGTIRSADARIGDKVTFAGHGLVRGTPFTTSGALLSPNETAGQGRNKLTLVADAAHNHITVDGTLPTLADIEDVPLATTARGRNVAELLAIIGVVVPETRTYRLKAQLVKNGDTYAFTRLAGTFGDSDIAGRFTVENRQPRLHIDATLATRRLDIVDVAPFIGYNPDLVAAGRIQAAAGQAGKGTPRLLPDAHLRVDALKAFDADVRYTVGTVRSKSVPVSDIDLTLALKDSLLTLSPLTFAMARGHVASDITIDARRHPVHTTYDIRLAPTPLARLLAGWGVAEAGTSGTVRGRIQLVGDGDTVAQSLASSRGRIAFVLPHGTFWTRNVQLAELDVGTFVQKMFEHKLEKPVEINCGLIGFTVRNGIAAADPILIDTSKNVMVGRGGFSFKNESLDLAFRADGKKFSLFSGQSPVGIDGYFAKPGINPISKDLLGRAGAGLGLAVVASPVAAVLAFVDVGDAKSTACGPVLAGATAAAQRTTSGKPRDDVGHGTTAKAEDGKRSHDERKSQRKKFLGIF